MSETNLSDARTKIEALEDLLGVKLPRDHAVIVEIKDEPELDLGQVVGGVTLQRFTRVSIAFDWSRAIFKATSPDI